jgi:hypothetical protein
MAPPGPLGATNNGLALQAPLEPPEQPPTPPAPCGSPWLSGRRDHRCHRAAGAPPDLAPRGPTRRRCTGQAPGDVPGADHVPLAPGRGAMNSIPSRYPSPSPLPPPPTGIPVRRPPKHPVRRPRSADPVENIPEPVRGVEAPGLPVRPTGLVRILRGSHPRIRRRHGSPTATERERSPICWGTRRYADVDDADPPRIGVPGERCQVHRG